MTIPLLTRRSVLHGSVAAAVAALAGAIWARAAADDAGASSGANSYGPSSPSNAAGNQLVALSDVPENGGVVLEDASVVVVRDADGVHAFSAVCTHQGCLVSTVSNGSISCPCHGSVFDAATGQVTQGPATQPLPKVAVQVKGDEVVREQ